MKIGNSKFLESTHICRFPPEQNLNILSLTYLSGRLGFMKRNKLWIGFSVVATYFIYELIIYPLYLESLTPGSINLFAVAVEILLPYLVVLSIIVLVSLKYGTTISSGRTHITRSTADSIDGFGGARGCDYSHIPSVPLGKSGLPVALRKERKRTVTFREGMKEHEGRKE